MEFELAQKDRTTRINLPMVSQGNVEGGIIIMMIIIIIITMIMNFMFCFFHTRAPTKNPICLARFVKKLTS